MTPSSANRATPDTMWALTFDRRRESWSGSTGMVRERVPRPVLDPSDREHALVRVHYTGFCGSDRGIWWRKSFGELVDASLTREGHDRRVFGHELFGEIVALHPEATARTGLAVGQTVSAESHVTCGVCASCEAGLHHVCLNEQILGISRDGVFAEYALLPISILWKTDTSQIRPEVAAVQEPFGNAVHACTATELRGKRVVVLGTGTIGLFAVLIARGMGATEVMGVEPNPANADRARRLGASVVWEPSSHQGDGPDPDVLRQIHARTNGLGADVVLEMSGAPSSVNTAIQAVKPGGHVVLFGVRDGTMPVHSFQRVVMRGLHLHGVVGRRLWDTWQTTTDLLSDPSTGVQQAVWEHVLDQGQGPRVSIHDWAREPFERTIQTYPKVLIDWRDAAAG